MATITDKINKIRQSIFGNDVRESIASGIEVINEEVVNTTGKQKHLEDTFDQLIINAGTSNAELVDARVDRNSGETFVKVGDRLDSHSASLADIVQVNFKEWGANSLGTSDTSPVLSSIITSVGSNKANLLIPLGDYKISQNIIIPSNISFKFNFGSKFVIDTDKKLTIKGNIDAGNYEIFSGNGLVDAHLSSSIINLGWYDGNSFNERWNKILLTLVPWQGYEILVPKPYQGQNGAEILTPTDTNWWCWKLTSTWVIDDKANQGVIHMHGDLKPVGILNVGVLIDDVNKPENIKFPLGLSLLGTNNTTNYFETGLEIRGGARIYFEGKTDVQYCNYGVVLGGSSQTREIGQVIFEALHIAFINNRHLIIDGYNYQVIGNVINDLTLEQCINDNQDCVIIKGNCQDNIFEHIQYISGQGKNARNIVVVQTTTQGFPIANEFKRIHATNATGYGLVTEDISEGVQTNKIEDTIVGYVRIVGGNALNINYTKGFKLTKGVYGANTILINSTSEYANLQVGNRHGTITDNGVFTLINNFGKKSTTGGYPDKNGYKVGNIVLNTYDNKVWIRVNNTGVEATDFIQIN